MRGLIMAALAGATSLFAANTRAADAKPADHKPTIAVFTKNLTNPAYQAFRIAADRIAGATGVKIVHFVPKQPDNVDEQIAMVDQVLHDKPDAVIFIPVDDVAMVGVLLPNGGKMRQRCPVVIDLRFLHRIRLRESFGAREKTVQVIEAAVLGVDHDDRLDAAKAGLGARRAARRTQKCERNDEHTQHCHFFSRMSLSAAPADRRSAVACAGADRDSRSRRSAVCSGCPRR